MSPKPKQPKGDKVPPFKPEYFWGFAALMLYKLGGVEIITQKQLEKFNMEHAPDVMYDHDKEAWIMRLKEQPKPEVIVTVPKKILKRVPKGFLS